MDKAKKRKIDEIWMNDDFGRYVLNAASGNLKEAQNAFEALIDQPWKSFSEINKQYSKRIAIELNSAKEFDEYLRLLDAENYDLVGFIISHNIFGYVYDLI